ncbi:MAG: methyltransferase [Bacteroidota bacterium]
MLKEKKKREDFQFKQFAIRQEESSMKVGTDGVLLGAWADCQDARSILDIGCGTGLIAIMLAQRNVEAAIHAVEIDEVSWQEACYNMQQAPWAQRLAAYNLPIQQYARETDNRYDLIVSNPPFFSGGTFSDQNDRNLIRHTVKLPHGDLLVAVRRLLSKEGRFCVILPLIEGLRFREIAERYHLFCTRMTEVRPKKDKKIERLLLQFEHERGGDEQVDELIIQHENRNDYTEDYIALTGEFYLNM